MSATNHARILDWISNSSIHEEIARGEISEIQLPLWPEDKKAMPNRLARASLFIPIARGRRKILDKAVLAAPTGTIIEFSGEQLNVSDCDVYLLCLDYARKQPLGTPIRISKYEFLKKLGRKDISGGKAYKNLDSQFDRLHLAQIKIKTERYNISIHLIHTIVEDKETNEYHIVIDNNVFQLFTNDEFAHVDWEKRLQISSSQKDLAKFLQTYIASHTKKSPHRINIESLKLLSGSNTLTRKFRHNLKEALAELERLKIIANSKMEEAIVTWERI